MLEQRVDVETPEQVALSFTIAGLGSKDPANPSNPLAPENRRVEIGR